MATSGEYTGTFNGTYGSDVGVKLKWSVTRQYKSSGMYSTVSVVIQMRRTQSYIGWYNANAGYSLSINGTEYTGTFSLNLSNYTVNTWYDVGITKTVNIKHGSDGTKTCAFSVTINTGLPGGSGTASGSGTFNTIPLFYWVSSSSDSTSIAAGKPVTNITASKWNTLNSYIKSYINTSYSYTTVSAGTTMTRAIIKQAADQLGVTLDSAATIKASYFISLRDKYNAY